MPNAGQPATLAQSEAGGWHSATMQSRGERLEFTKG